MDKLFFLPTSILINVRFTGLSQGCHRFFNVKLLIILQYFRSSSNFLQLYTAMKKYRSDSTVPDSDCECFHYLYGLGINWNSIVPTDSIFNRFSNGIVYQSWKKISNPAHSRRQLKTQQCDSEQKRKNCSKNALEAVKKKDWINRWIDKSENSSGLWWSHHNWPRFSIFHAIWWFGQCVQKKIQPIFMVSGAKAEWEPAMHEQNSKHIEHLAGICSGSSRLYKVVWIRVW